MLAPKAFRFISNRFQTAEESKARRGDRRAVGLFRRYSGAARSNAPGGIPSAHRSTVHAGGVSSDAGVAWCAARGDPDHERLVGAAVVPQPPAPLASN